MGAFTQEKAIRLTKKMEALRNNLRENQTKKGKLAYKQFSKVVEEITGIDIMPPTTKDLLRVRYFIQIVNQSANLQVTIPPEHLRFAGEYLSMAIISATVQALGWAYGMPTRPPEVSPIIVPGQEQRVNPVFGLIDQFVAQVSAEVEKALEQHPELSDPVELAALMEAKRGKTEESAILSE